MKKNNLLLLIAIACINPLCAMDSISDESSQSSQEFAPLASVGDFFGIAGDYMEDPDTTDFEDLIKQNPHFIDAQDIGGRTLLHHTIMENRDDLVRILLQHNANSNIQDIRGNTPLHWAAINHNLSTFKLLQQYGADMHIKNNADETPTDLLTTRELKKVTTAGA